MEGIKMAQYLEENQMKCKIRKCELELHTVQNRASKIRFTIVVMGQCLFKQFIACDILK